MSKLYEITEKEEQEIERRTKARDCDGQLLYLFTILGTLCANRLDGNVHCLRAKVSKFRVLNLFSL
jgi:hypothetical protein